MNRNPNQEPARRRTPTLRVPITLRVPQGLVAKIEQELAHRDIPLSRNTWFLEAVIEKLRRNESGASNGAK